MNKTKKILIINSSPDLSKGFLDILDELSLFNHDFCLLSEKKNKKIFNIFKSKNWGAKKIYLGPSIKNIFNIPFFLITYPLNLILIFFKLTYHKYKKKIESIICLEDKEKILITPIAKILGIKIIWLEKLNIGAPKTIASKIIFIFYKIFSKWAGIIVFSDKNKKFLEKKGIVDNKIIAINPGIKLKNPSFQENIFSEISNKDKVKNKFFTIGVITPLVKNQKIETILKSIKIAMSASLQMQLIVIGDGEERKNLSWMAKKMEIDNNIWFVGEQAQTSKWLNNFDIFIVGNEKIKSEEMESILLAMHASLPIIGPSNEGLEDIMLDEEQEFLINMDNSEELAQKIIKIQKNQSLREKIGQLNKETVIKNFTTKNQVEKILKII